MSDQKEKSPKSSSSVMSGPSVFALLRAFGSGSGPGSVSSSDSAVLRVLRVFRVGRVLVSAGSGERVLDLF
ncbi:MAG TPA: hypothetical protein EYQ80_03435 [Candidatus Poseidoniales archaeon]|nr:hypothetical protein [Candidatus Poseidoniales archaeon]